MLALGMLKYDEQPVPALVLSHTHTHEACRSQLNACTNPNKSLLHITDNLCTCDSHSSQAQIMEFYFLLPNAELFSTTFTQRSLSGGKLES